MDYHVAIKSVANGRPYECRGTYESIVCIGWQKPTDQELIDAYPIAAAAIAAEAADLATKRGNLNATAIATLRQWATDARGTTATSGNTVTVLNTMLPRLATFFDKFADLLQVQRLDQ
jgi:hypothetical protein